MATDEEKLTKEDAILFFNSLVVTGVFQKSIYNNDTDTMFYYLGDWKSLELSKDTLSALAYSFYHLIKNKFVVAVKPKGKLIKQADKPHVTRYVFIDDWNKMDKHNKSANFVVFPGELILKSIDLPIKN
jgi:hypothetical protein